MPNKNKLNFAINLLWVRPGKVGGTEVVIRNLLDGFELLNDDFMATLIVSEDNADTFRHYVNEDDRYSISVAPIKSVSIGKRIIWQNLNLNRYIRKLGLTECFSPVYDRPLLNGGLKYISVIHDIQAYHYPEYHPLYEVLYSKLCWMSDKIFSKGIVAISNFVAEDLIKTYGYKRDKLVTIYNPVIINKDDFCDFNTLAGKYGISEKSYYYTVSQMIPHKNIETLIKVIAELKKDGEDSKLLISGINGNAVDSIKNKIREYNIEDNVVFTGYVTDTVRNTLYKYSKEFLFSSVFEGFGIPPIEAMMCGANVVATKCACIPEVTQSKAEYVDDPYDEQDWIKHMKHSTNKSDEIDISVYDLKNIATKYLSFFKKVWG